ncbi:MAG: M20/M25/M40 family metallo-hydrolase [Chloroflexota bacterium]
MSEGRDADLRAAVAARRDLLREVIGAVHATPELAHEEHRTAAALCRTLEGLGCVVETGIAGMATAFRATLRGDLPGRTVGIVANYDAVPSVPEPGVLVPIHSCGHGPNSAAVVGAVAALAAQRSSLRGGVVVMGCPADEIHAPGTVARGGGKAISARAGAWAGIDAALYAHPEFLDTAWLESAWMRRDTARVHGWRDLADAAPRGELRALVAAAEAAIDRPGTRLMLETLAFDGDVEDRTGVGWWARFLLWAPDETGLDELAGWLRERVAADWEAGDTVPGIAPDAGVRAVVADAHRAAGRAYVEPPMALPFAADFGVVTRTLPAALVGIGRPGGWAFHTTEGYQQFASEAGLDAAVDTATVLALAAVRLTAPA